MADDVEITVNVQDNTAPGFAAVNQRLTTLRTRATAAGTAMQQLTQRADQTAAALRVLNLIAGVTAQRMEALAAQTRDASRAVQQLGTRATAASQRMVDLRAEVDELEDSAHRAGASVDRLGEGVRDLGDGSRDARRHIGGLTGDLDGLDSQLGDTEDNAKKAAGAIGAGGGGLAASLKGVAVAAAVSAAPALGAFVPLMAGVAAASVAVKLGFSGIGQALEDQGKDAEKYQEDLKKMSPAQRELTKELVDVKKEFKGLGRDVQAAMLPGFTAALRDAAPLLKIFRGAVKDAAGNLGDLAKQFGKAFKDSGFQKDFARVLKLGNGSIKEITASFGPFTRSLLDFGAASKPTLDAFTDGISGLIGKDLPGFFRGLQPGIEGSASMFRGLFDAIDQLLPALGRFSGGFSKNLGPLLGELFRYAGNLTRAFLDGLAPALDALKPLADSATRALQSMGLVTEPLGKGFGGALAGAIKLVTPVFQNLFDLAAIAIPVVKDLASAIIGPLVSAFMEVTNVDEGVDNLGGGIRDFGTWVHDHRAGIEAAFRSFAVAILDFVTVTVDGAPSIFNAFRLIGEAALDMAGVVVEGIAIALAPVPGLGDKAFEALGDFNRFRDGVKTNFDDIGGKIEDFRANALPKLKGARLGLETSEFDRGLAAAGSTLKSTKLDKAGKLTAENKTATGVAAAQKRVNSLLGRAVDLIARNKVSPVVAIAQSAINSLYGANVAIGAVRRATGGVISGPGSGTSDDVPAMLSNGEFVVNAQATKKNRGLLEAINSGTLRGFASGGISDSMKRARSEATSLLTVSYFGQRAGRTRSEFGAALGAPDSLNDLVGSLNKWRSLIKGATAGATESRLLKALNSTASTLIKNEKALTKVNGELDKAKDKLSSLKDAAAQLNSQVASGILASGNITNMASGGGLVTLGGIKSGLAGQAGEAAEFASALEELRKRGLNGQSISEIAQAGLSGGGLATARTLLGASSADIKEINALESQLKASAGAAGKATADAMYGAGIAAANGLVKGLQAQQDKLEAIMAKAAAGLEKAIEKALGVKGKASGGIIGAAAGGPRAGWTLVGEQGPELARLPYGSTVYPAGATRQMLGAGGGGGGLVQVNLNVDGQTLARVLIDPLSGEIRRINGGDVQGALGKGKVRV